ncbi:MAG: hypothetical protein GWN13_14550, partial [Phycisphaerae bacterium]|nr:hypothetical protein [Phycisphaerae bacterium]NIW99435.1 hypothetical protein [Phycisphaerae bacterium]
MTTKASVCLSDGQMPFFHRKGFAMEDKKNLIQVANRIQESLMKLKNNRYLELMKRLTGFAGKLQELTAESRKMGISLV